jgi:hypothetical protein
MPKSSRKFLQQEGESQSRSTYRCSVIGDKLFKNQKQCDMFIRLHRKKCALCVQSNPSGYTLDHKWVVNEDLNRAKKCGSTDNLHAPEQMWEKLFSEMSS